ncbi:PKD-like domain-containing protein [Mucilaginibacter celer]|uniref:Gliding motility-associated C-terminal domain-containing protein n=1 Tax=Mucilaginibacter celer TaxID=2305508 RepID=A0A494VNA7_9SPHI|nr:PKD-like domain-containing protein [Mucilaginibacter celer]AYL96154.1 gliding motility-associated C-terminal domain-containing protein [Mucilaginibacter celer]
MSKRLFTILFLFLALPFGLSAQNCALSVNISSPGTTICSGSSVVLTAATTAGTGPFTYLWSTGETGSTISANKAGTYTVTVTDKTTGCKAVAKGITLREASTPAAPAAKNAVVCQNSPATLTATGSGGVYQWYDAPVSGNFLKTGDTYVTPPIMGTTTFYVETTVGGCTSPRTAVTVFITGKPDVAGAAVCSGGGATLLASGADSYTWYDAATGGKVVGSGPSFRTPPLLKTTIYYVVAATNGCTSAPTPVIARVNPPPPTPVVTNVNICSGQVASLHADAPEGFFDWFDVPTGGVSLISSPDYTTPALTATKTYYVQVKLNDCESPRVPVTVFVSPIPQTPAPQTATVCYNTGTTLTAAAKPVGTYAWYDAAIGGRLLKTGVTFNTPALTSNTTYYVENRSNAGCISERAAVKVAVNPPVATPVAAGAVICSGAMASLFTTSPADGNYQWYDAPVGGKLLAASPHYTTPALTESKTYYLQATANGCASTRTAVQVTVIKPLAAPKVSNTTVCYNGAAVLTATGASGSYAWYDSATGGKLLSTGSTYVTPNLTSQATYYVETSVNDCVSPRTAVTVDVITRPSPPVASGTSVCSGTSAQLKAGGSGIIEWFGVPAGGTPLFTGSNFTTPKLSEKTVYYIQSRVGDCVSQRVPVTVNISSTDDTQFVYPSGTFTPKSPNPKPIINNPSGGTFTSSPAGLVFVDDHTGEIDVKASAPGQYIVTITSNGSCAATYSAGVNIVSVLNARFAYGGPFCQFGLNPQPKFFPNASAGTFTATPAGLTFTSTATGEINLAKTQPGTYEVTNTIYNFDGTIASSEKAKVTIDQGAIADAGPDQTVAPGSTVQLAGSIIGVAGGRWSGGLGKFSDPDRGDATYTPAAGERQVTLTLTTDDPSGTCGPGVDKVIINITTGLPAPTAPGTSTCKGSIATVSATGPGGTYHWYDAAENGTELSTGPNFITPPLTQTTTYYVNTTVGNLISEMTAVTVRVNEQPQPPIVRSLVACEGSPTTLTARGSKGTYQWYDAPVGGTLLSLDSIYVTPGLVSNTSYYVQAVVDGCVSERTKVDVTVTKLAKITSASANIICSGVAQSYDITADQPGTTFLWSRAAVAGISNTAVSNQSSPQITETLTSATADPVDVTYTIIPVVNGCSGQPFNYVVTVYPSPQVTSDPASKLCNMTTGNYAVGFNIPGVSFSWSREVVPGISNLAVRGQMANVIREVLYNTTNKPIDVTYVFNYQTSNCSGPPFKWVATVNPSVNITSKAADETCSGSALDYTITSNVSSATFTWSRSAVPGISNPASGTQTGNKINEVLVNKSASAINVIYVITPKAFDCDGIPFAYLVKVNPEIPQRKIRTNSPVCLNSDIKLNVDPVAKATYRWTGPDNYNASGPNPVIKNVTKKMAGIYSLYITVNNCTSLADTATVVINDPPTAKAGKNVRACVTDEYIQLEGIIGGGTNTGVWSSSGTGHFSPSENEKRARYIPSDKDKTAGSVVLTLSSTSKDDCDIATSDMTITFGKIPGVDAGKSIDVCEQQKSVKMDGTVFAPGGGKWTTSGTGTFISPESEQGAVYQPSDEDVKKGSVKLTLTANNPGQCYFATGTMTITFLPPPSVNAGGVRYVQKNHTITLTPTVSDENVQYQWLPATGLNDNKIKEPTLTGDVDGIYTLYVTDKLGCVGKSEVMIKVSPDITIPNTFTPNGDGINDFWEIKGLIAYESTTVDVFNRYGEKLFHSVGYSSPWDGLFNGKQLPAGTYFYIIDMKTGKPPLSGPVTILR